MYLIMFWIKENYRNTFSSIDSKYIRCFQIYDNIDQVLIDITDFWLNFD